MDKQTLKLKKPSSRYIGYLWSDINAKIEFPSKKGAYPPDITWELRYTRVFGDEIPLCHGLAAYNRALKCRREQNGPTGCFAAMQWLKLIYPGEHL